MKIGIFTHPLVSNYGGILQNFALQYVLKTLGHEVVTINRLMKENDIKILISILKQNLLKHHDIKLLFKDQQSEIYENSRNFINKYINKIDVYNADNDILKKISQEGFDVIVVGSDQVWRPDYVHNIYHEFLDFLEEDEKIRRISYAASFGTDKWLFTEEQSKRCKEFIQKFDAVSVRENSGIELCNKYFNKDSICVLDPTLLVDKEVYMSLCSEMESNNEGNKLFTYVLDSSKEKRKIIEDTMNYLGLNEITNQPKFSLEGSSNKKYIKEDFIYPRVEGWIKGFIEADYVVTDSFHGTAFSIIFNKPFIAIVNEDRGASRFQSLLEKFDLTDRLISTNTKLDEKFYETKIDYDNVNRKLEELKKYSLEFLKNSIEK